MSLNASPTKKRLVESGDQGRSEESTGASAHAGVAARARFLQSLDAFASDSDSDAETSELASESYSLNAHSSSFFDTMSDAAQDHASAALGNAHHHAVNTQVGRELLQQMFVEQQQQQQQQGARGPTTNASGVPRVVDAYVPLSTNGFLDTTDESINLRHLKVGAILCQKSAFVPSKSSPVTSPTTTTATNTSSTSPTESSPKPPAPTLTRFKKNSALTEEERLYGKELTPDMADHLFEVSRVDLAQHVVEGVFLDGTRRKLRAMELRTAGFVEQQLYRRWKADPSSRPAQRVVVPSVDIAVNDEAPATTPGTDAPVSPTPTTWWVLPNLIVRVVAELAGEKWFGKKVAVEWIKRKENKVRLRAVTESAGKLILSSSPTDVLEIIGLDGVETVVPKKGGQGIIVTGPHRGEIVTVRNRLRDGASGELRGIEVASTLAESDEQVFEVSPQELCEMRRA